MSGFFTAACLAIGSLSFSPGHATKPDPPTDWVLATATIDAGGATGLVFRLIGSGYGVGDEPVAAGEGFSWPGHYEAVHVFSLGARGIRSRTGGGAGAIDISVDTPVDESWRSFTFDYSLTIDGLPLDAGERVAILAFFPGGNIDHHSTTLDVVSGTGAVAVRSGFGSVAVHVVDPAEPDVSAGLGPLGAAYGLTRSFDAQEGMVGAFNIDECEGICQGAFAGPGIDGSFSQVHPHLVYGAGALLGSYRFAGPSGTWDFSWTGTAFSDERPLPSLLSNPVIMGFAPIGDDHMLFGDAPPIEIPLR